MNNFNLTQFINEWLVAWTAQDIDRLLSFYSDDMEYLDPNTRGELKGKDAFRGYVGKLFSAWPKMSWHAKTIFEHAGGSNCTATWRAEITKPDGQILKLDGMDLILIADGKIIRNEVYFDRSRLI
ncbi:MAG: nuclear transport factor 2 family protein [bacterium]